LLPTEPRERATNTLEPEIDGARMQALLPREPVGELGKAHDDERRSRACNVSGVKCMVRTRRRWRSDFTPHTSHFTRSLHHAFEMTGAGTCMNMVNRPATRSRMSRRSTIMPT